MTSIATAPASQSGPDLPLVARLRAHPLTAILLLAAAIRIPLAFWPNVLHPDEIFQYIEPAWRVLGHDSIIFWEWRYGMRPWLLPTLAAGPIALADWIVPGGTSAFVTARLLAALSSLLIVVSGWYLGARTSRTHAIVAAFVAAVWCECVLFAPHTLSEPLATAIILPAALLLTATPASRLQLALGGAALVLAFVVRFQYGPAIAVLGVVALWTHRRNLLPMIAGGLAALALTAAADAFNGQVPFVWVIENIRQNLLNDRASAFGVMGAGTYIASFWLMWSFAVLPLAVLIVIGWRRAPLLFVIAIVNVAVHSAIPHKEYRFIFLSVVILVLIAALGSADLVEKLRERPAWRRAALPLVLAAWTLVSVALGVTGTAAQYWQNGIGAAKLAATLRGDPQMCGLALYKTYFPSLPERERLVGRLPLYGFDPDDPLASRDIVAAVSQAAPAFNRIIAPRKLASELPASFAQRNCGTIGETQACVFVRGGGCDAAAGTAFLGNTVLLRIDR